MINYLIKYTASGSWSKLWYRMIRNLQNWLLGGSLSQEKRYTEKDDFMRKSGMQK